MCGIVGYIGEQPTKNFIIDGLKKLEYRGYDSAGAFLFNNEGYLRKCKGKVADLEKKMDDDNLSSCTIGMGHTRWATHGIPNTKNSHPHVSNNGKIFIVHNGIIENYASIKQILIENLDDKYILLKTDAQILDQVTITGTTELSDEVETGYGKKKKKSVGFSTSTITSEDISPGAVTIVDAIRGKFTNVQVAYNQDGAATGNKPQIYVRGGSLSINNSAAAIFDVEGLIYTEVPDFIDPQQIESITLLRSMGATNRYGSQGRGGVFLIKMKSLSRKVERLLNSLKLQGI